MIFQRSSIGRQDAGLPFVNLVKIVPLPRDLGLAQLMYPKGQTYRVQTGIFEIFHFESVLQTSTVAELKSFTKLHKVLYVM